MSSKTAYNTSILPQTGQTGSRRLPIPLHTAISFLQLAADDLAGFFVDDYRGGADLLQCSGLGGFAGGGFGHGPDGFQFLLVCLAAGQGVGGQALRVYPVADGGVVHLAAQEFLAGFGDNGHQRLVRIGGVAVGHGLGHGGVLTVAVFIAGADDQVGGVVVILHVAEGAAAAHHQQHRQGGDLLAGEFQRVLGVGAGVGQPHAVGHRHHHPQEQGQHHGFNGEERQILQDPRHAHNTQNLILRFLRAADVHIPPGEDQLLQDDVYKQADEKPAEHHPGGGHLAAVQA